MAKSKFTSWGAARWSTWITDHITGDDRHDWHADQWRPKGDNAGQWRLRRDNAIHCSPKQSIAVQCNPRGDDAGRWVTMVWLDSLVFNFVTNKAVVRLIWSLSLL